MYIMIRSCYHFIFRLMPRKAAEYLGTSVAEAILFPLNVFLIERCISYMEGASYQRFWPAFCLLVFCSVILLWIQNRMRVLDVEFTQEFTDKCMPEVIGKLNRIHYYYFEDARAADTLSRMGGDPASALTGLFQKSASCIALLIRLYGTALIYFRLFVAAGLALFALLGIQIYIGILSQREVVRLYETETQEERKLQYLGHLLCGKDSVFDLKVNQSISYVKDLQKKKAGGILKNRIRISMKAERYYMLNLFLMLVWTAALLFLMVTKIGDGSITLGLFVALMGSYPAMTGYQNTLSYYLSSMNGLLLVYRALQDLWSYEEESNIQELESSESYTVEFRDVSFRYPGTEEQVLKHVSFRVDSDETLAIVGENGSGKSTIIKLLCGLYQPDEGEILVNGKPVCGLAPESRRRLTGVVFQNFEKYSLTALENVGLGNVEYIEDVEKIREALRHAGAAEVTEELPKGLRTNLNHLEEDGVSLSGGQWQRLAIARAYMAESVFFLLDEPTASMDPVAESRMYHSFVDILKGKGIILVSHRLASAMMADRILVLDKGVLAQVGKIFVLHGIRNQRAG